MRRVKEIAGALVGPSSTDELICLPLTTPGPVGAGFIRVLRRSDERSRNGSTASPLQNCCDAITSSGILPASTRRFTRLVGRAQFLRHTVRPLAPPSETAA